MINYTMLTSIKQAQPCEFHCPIMFFSLCLCIGTPPSPALKSNSYEQLQRCCSLTRVFILPKARSFPRSYFKPCDLISKNSVHIIAHIKPFFLQKQNYAIPYKVQSLTWLGYQTKKLWAPNTFFQHTTLGSVVPPLVIPIKATRLSFLVIYLDK